MRPIPPAESRGGVAVVFGANQPEYQPLPARTDGTYVVTAWELTAVERAAVLAGAPIVLQMLTSGAALLPVVLGVEGCEEDA